MLVTLTGPNSFLLKQESGHLTNGYIKEHGDMAVERLDGEEASAEQMQAAVQSLPFLTPRKLIILREPGKQKAWAEQIDEVLNNIAETNDVIIIEPRLDKRLNYYKTLKKSTNFRDFGELDAGGLAKWAVEYTKAKDGELTLVDAKFLIDRIGTNQQLLRQELDKLLIYDHKITKQNIELLCEPVPQSTVFELLDAALAGNIKQASQLYQEQRALKVEPQAIIAMLAWQLNVLAVIKSAGNKPTDQIAKEAKLSPYVIKKSHSLAARMPFTALKVNVAELLKLDTALKTQSIDADEALQLYLLKLGQK